MNPAGIFFLCLFLLVILPGAIWGGYVFWRAHSAGLPPPPLSAYIPFKKSSSSGSNYPIAPRRGGVVGWVQDKISGLKASRTGGYESSRAPNRGFGPLDPDSAWDDRVGHEADARYGQVGDYEEQELGLHPQGQYGGSGYGERVMPGYGEQQERGRSRSRDDFSYVGGGQRGLDARYDEEMGRRENPFGEGAERSDLGGVSPRPVEMDAGGHKRRGSGDTTVSGKSGRKSVFHEAM